RLFHRGGGGRGVVQQQGLGVGRLLVHGHAQVAQHGDHDFHRLGVDQLVGQVVGDLALRQVAARLAQRDQRLQALAALGHVLFAEHGLVEAELLHQGPFLGLADLHAQGLGLLGRGGLGGRRRFFLGELGLDVGEVLLVDLGLALGGVGLRLAAALGAAGGGLGGALGLGRAAGLLLGGSGGGGGVGN